jgi:hypothetical protein
MMCHRTFASKHRFHPNINFRIAYMLLDFQGPSFPSKNPCDAVDDEDVYR